ncbi:MAG TPA: response regulator [Anaerolineae bacterium]|nr:response regulator [Anaerolineae bacterium]
MEAEKNAKNDIDQILIVEDSPTQAEQLKYLLEQHNYTVLVAESGKEALTLLDEHTPLLIISDIVMPEMNGYELCQEIKSGESTRDIPVILLTSLSGAEDVLEGLACGADNFLTKPYHKDYLISHIEQILANKKLYKSERVRVGVEILFGGKKRFITANQQQMLTLLISSYEAAVQKNKELVKSREELIMFNERLEESVKERTAELSAEIATRKSAEETLRESEAKYRNLTESLDELIYRADPETFVATYVNRAVEKICGYTVEEWLGDPTLWESTIYPEDKERVFALFTESQRKIKSGAVEYRIISKDKTERWVEDHISWEKDQQGNVVSLNGVISDITERKQAEEEKKKLEAQLYQSQKMEAIGTLAGGVAHDFNNLLTVIIGNAHLVLMDVIKDESLREKIEEIEKAGDKAASLTRQLLAFSRKQIIIPRVLDLNELLTGIEKMLGRLIGEDVELLTIPEPALWRVEVDPGQMEQVIMNMAINAKDAMPLGGKLTIETANIDLDESYFRKHGIEGEKPGHYVMLAVSDTGIGMDKETLSRIFDPFFTTKEVGKGTGLGLSTAYGIVKQNNGFIWVYSEPGQGSTFKVYLPRAEGDADSEEKQRLPVIELDGSETILLVEDDDGLRKFAQKVLLLHGYKVLDAENGEDALRVSQAHEGPIHLMITDVVMPRMGGKELSEKLRPFYPRIKVIYMSGYTDNAIVEHGVLAPGLNFLQKPFAPESLARKVREVLDAEK